MLNILMLHNSYIQSGGEDISTDAELLLLKKNKINVDIIVINNKEEIEKYNKIELALNTSWSRYYYSLILKKIRQNHYTLIHVQNSFPLFSPSLFYAAREAKVKIVMTVRNYRLICPNALMYINNKICQKCVGKIIPYPGITNKCYRNSYSASIVTVGMLSFHNLRNTWGNKIDGFICISNFVKEQLINAGFDQNKLFVKYNFVNTKIEPKSILGNYYVFTGRLSSEKGIDLLIQTFQKNKLELLIIGQGPLEEKIKKTTQHNVNIRILGKLDLTETYEIISNAKALIFPSRWHEPFGRSIAEAFAHGIPVIGSALGGVTELIKDEINGFLFDPYKEGDLERVINNFEFLPRESIKNMRINAFNSYKELFIAKINFESILNIYNSILQK